MIHDKELSPMTVNIRIRNMRALIRYCHKKEWIGEPIHFAIVDCKQNLQSFSSYSIVAALFYSGDLSIHHSVHLYLHPPRLGKKD
ncbi:hypothetical protein [Neobacillus sp. CF12]|uniref:hypothetical protein n=1 Tax=Neobacillus sp. CF12 TaxID=3055864 RepID=UPI0025A11260|nr:hypothetical protein [Neobacillus sp. CF12]MDM5326797.1 hypothetical protein [Neobacillus sp. CF12]